MLPNKAGSSKQDDTSNRSQNDDDPRSINQSISSRQHFRLEAMKSHP
jgi:hypothetical protein